MADTHGGRRTGAGRPAGKLSSLAMAAKEIMDSKGYNPFESLIEIAQDTEGTPLDLRLQAHKELCKYHSPQLKSLDVNMAVKGSMAVKLVSFAEEQAMIQQQQAIYDAHQARIAQNDENIIDAEYTKSPDCVPEVEVKSE